MGRVQKPGEPWFLPEDTDGAIALAEEERDTCPSCGMPKAWCRDPANQFAFEPREEMCFVTWRLAQHRNGQNWQGKHDDTKQATQVVARFRDGREPDIAAGLGLAAEDADGEQDSTDDRRQH